MTSNTLDYIQFNNFLISNYVDKNKNPVLIYEENKVFNYEIDSNVITINHNNNTMKIDYLSMETYFEFDDFGKIHGLKKISGDYLLKETYNHGVRHGESYTSKPHCYTSKTYINGILQGIFVNREHNLKIRGNYKNGVYNGLITYYKFENSDFKQFKVEKYDNGVLIDTFEEENPENLQNTISIKIGKVYGFTPYKPKEIFASKRY